MSPHDLSPHDLVDTWTPLRAATETLKKNAATAFSVSRNLASADGYDSLKVVQKQLAKLEKVSLDATRLESDLRQAAEQVGEWLDGEWERRAGAVSEDLVSWFGERGLPLQIEGDGLLFHAPLSIRLQPRRDRAEILYAGDVVKTNVPLSRERVFKAWQDARALLRRLNTDPDVLVDELREAFDTLGKLDRLGANRRARLPDLHFQIFVQRQKRSRFDPRRSRLAEYPRYQFGWDLALLMLNGLPDDIKIFDAPPSAQRGGSGSVVVVLADGERRALSHLRLDS